jgi:hypothetical protein
MCKENVILWVVAQYSLKEANIIDENNAFVFRAEEQMKQETSSTLFNPVNITDVLL